MAKKTKISLPTENELKKLYPTSGMASNILLSSEDSLWIPCSSPSINYLLGGGVPYGKILEIFGQESGGKTLLATDFAKCTQLMGGVVLWVDAEAAYDLFWNEQLGIDNEKVVLYQETAVEPISDWIADMSLYWRSKLTNNEPILIVIDSVAALDCLDNINSKQIDAKAEMGNRAKAIYKMFRIRNQMLNELGVTTICINQLRDKVGASNYEDPNTTPGGKALAFYASQRLGIYRGKQIKSKINGVEERVGNHVSIRAIKNKVAPPRPTLKSEVYFVEEYTGEVGFSRYIGFPTILKRLAVVEQKGSRYYRGDSMIANGEPSFTKLLFEDEKLKKSMLRKSKINTVGKSIINMNKVVGNRFPVKGVTVEKHDSDV